MKYEYIDGKKHIICRCEELKMAKTLATLLATNDESHDKYYISDAPGAGFVAGGGWYICYYTDENYKLHTSTLS